MLPAFRSSVSSRSFSCISFINTSTEYVISLLRPSSSRLVFSAAKMKFPIFASAALLVYGSLTFARPQELRQVLGESQPIYLSEYPIEGPDPNSDPNPLVVPPLPVTSSQWSDDSSLLSNSGTSFRTSSTLPDPNAPISSIFSNPDQFMTGQGVTAETTPGILSDNFINSFDLASKSRSLTMTNDIDQSIQNCAYVYYEIQLDTDVPGPATLARKACGGENESWGEFKTIFQGLRPGYAFHPADNPAEILFITSVIYSPSTEEKDVILANRANFKSHLRVLRKAILETTVHNQHELELTLACFDPRSKATTPASCH